MTTRVRPRADDDHTDDNEVKAKLEELEDELERSNAEADKDALDKILATEYAGDSNATKKNYLETIQPNPGRRWRYSNFVLTLAGEHATLRYHLDRIDGDTTKSYTTSIRLCGVTIAGRRHRRIK